MESYAPAKEKEKWGGRDRERDGEREMQREREREMEAESEREGESEGEAERGRGRGRERQRERWRKEGEKERERLTLYLDTELLLTTLGTETNCQENLFCHKMRGHKLCCRQQFGQKSANEAKKKVCDSVGKRQQTSADVCCGREKLEKKKRKAELEVRTIQSVETDQRYWSLHELFLGKIIKGFLTGAKTLKIVGRIHCFLAGHKTVVEEYCRKKRKKWI